MISKLLFHSENYSSPAVNIGLFILRVSVGLFMAFGHGLGKLPVSAGFIGGVAQMGMPAPELFAWCAALSEFIGGLFIALGLATRFSAISLGFTMAVAGFLVHGSDPFDVKEKAFLYLIVCVCLFFTGAGKYSVDGLINGKK